MTSLTEMGDFQPVGENGAYPDTDFQEGFSKTLEHMTFLNRFSVTQEMVEDNKIGLMQDSGQQIYGILLPQPGKVRRSADHGGYWRSCDHWWQDLFHAGCRWQAAL